MKKGKVTIASKYYVDTLVNNVLVRQSNFPFIYDADLDILIGEDNDELLKNKWEETTGCFLNHTGNDEKFLRKWLKNQPDNKIINFIRELLGADTNIKWTGYRILAAINPSVGNTYWRFELFSRHPKSSTAVYSGELAPNVLAGHPKKITFTE